MRKSLFSQDRLGTSAKVVRGVLLALLGATLAGSVFASAVTLDAFERGFITQAGVTNPTNDPPGTRDYLLGNCALSSCFSAGGGEFRNFFGFAIPTFTGNVTSAILQLATVGVDLQQGSSLTALFTSLGTISSFGALGTGTAYGSVSYSAADANMLVSIALNSDAIAALLADQGGSFLIGGRAIGVGSFGPLSPNQLVYEHSGHITPPDLTRLIITTDATQTVPEPGTLALVGLALVGLATNRRHSNAANPSIASGRSASDRLTSRP